MHLLWFSLVCLIWGSSFILMKKALIVFGPLTVGGGRVLSGALTGLLIWWLLQRGRRRPDEHDALGKPRWPLGIRDLPALLLVMVLGYAYPFAMQPHLIGKYGDSGFFGMMVSFVPLMTMVVSVPLLGVRPRAREVVGVAVGLMFIALLFGDGLRRAISPTDLALAVSVPLMYATCNTFLKRRFSGVAPLPLSVSAMSLAALVVLPVGLAREPVRAVAAEPTTWAWPLAALLLLGVVGTGLAMWMFYKLIQERGPLFAGMVTYVVPLGAVLWGVADGETLTLLQCVALGGVLGAVALVQSGRPGVVPARGRVDEQAKDERGGV